MKNTFAFTAFLVASLGLVACGDDDNSSYNSIPPTNNPVETADEIQFSIVEGSYSDRGSEYAERIDVVLRDGQNQTTSKVFKGVNSEPDYESSYTYIAPNYYRTFKVNDEAFEALISPTIDVLTPTSYSYTLSSASNNKPLTFTRTLKSYDISGITTADEQRFFTPLSIYRLNNAQLPTNSICYADIVEKPSFPVFEVGLAFLNENTIEEWLNVANMSNSNNYDYEIVQVGENNEYRAIRLVDPDNYQGNIFYEAAVEMNGNVYTANYITNGYTRNTDPDVETVECTYFNDTAADYLETQILANGYLAAPFS